MHAGMKLFWAAAVGLSCAAASALAQSPAPKPAAAGNWRESVRAFAEQHFKHPAWGYSHSSRDYALARELAAKDGVKLDDDVLYAAAYLHDIAAFKPWDVDGKDHADVAADLVESLLQETGFPAAKLDALRGAIRTHMFDREPASPEAIYLHDADAIDWLGAIGVARVMALVDSEGGRPDGPAMVKMLEENLAGAPDGVLSPAGRALVPARKAELAAFIESLKAQSANLKDL
jgi:hypothetical protein